MITELLCPNCSALLNAFETDVEGLKPVPGDLGVCWECRLPYMMTGDEDAIGGRKLTPEEFETVWPYVEPVVKKIEEASTPAEVIQKMQEEYREGH